MNKTLKRWLVFAGVHLAVIGAVFLFKAYLALVSIPVVKLLGQCAFAKLTHLYCPGCGGTRAATALMHFDLLQSLKYNPLVLLLAAVFVYYDVQAFVNIIKKKDRVLKINAKLLYVTAAGVIIFFLIRNLLMVVWQFDLIGDLVGYWR